MGVKQAAVSGCSEAPQPVRSGTSQSSTPTNLAEAFKAQGRESQNRRIARVQLEVTV